MEAAARQGANSRRPQLCAVPASVTTESGSLCHRATTGATHREAKDDEDERRQEHRRVHHVERVAAVDRADIVLAVEHNMMQHRGNRMQHTVAAVGRADVVLSY
jgi:hypothetical protein